jgi:hydrogenase-4 component F
MRNLLIGFGVFTALLAAVIIGAQRNYKRMLAYSSMENMGIILVGFALGGIGAVGAVIQVVAHAFAKSSAFYEAGNILVAFNSKSMAAVQGVIGRLKVSGYLFTLSCLAVTGAPPFGVFIGEFLIISQAMQAGDFLLVVLLAVAYVYTFVGLNSQAIRMVFGQRPSLQEGGSAQPGLQKESWLSIAVPLVNLTVSLAIGLYMVPEISQAIVGAGL